MDGAKLFAELGALAFVLLIFLNGMIAGVVVPPKLLDELRRRTWTGKDLLIVLGAGMVVFISGLVFTGLYFWGPLFGLSLAVLLSWLIVWLLGKIRPHLSLLQKSGVLFVVYLLIALMLAAPTVLKSPVSFWMQARGILILLATALLLALTAAGALLVVAGVAAYFVLAGEIARAVLVSRPALAPTSAPVPLADRQPLLPLRPLPQEVQLAVSLIYWSLALGPIKVVFDFRYYFAQGLAQGLVFIVVINALTVAFLVFLALRIGQGRNWARITYIVLFILGLPFFLLTGPGEFGRNKLVFLLSITQLGLGIATVRLLIQKGSIAYFRS